MTTRSEALLQALQQVDGSITDADTRINEAIVSLERSNNEHATAIREAARSHVDSLKNASQTASNGLIVAAVLVIAGSVFGAHIKAADEKIRTLTQTMQMVLSVLSLQQKYGAMTYNFVLRRSYAEGSTSDERRTILNGLLMSGIIQDNYQGDPNLLFIDEKSDEFIALVDLAQGLKNLKF